jgi:hypothetical protein
MIGKMPALHSRRSILMALVLLFAVVFFLPYIFPVTPVVSISFLVGYNNRAAFLLLAFGSILVGILVRERFPEAEPADRPLGLSSLFAALTIALACCASRLFPISQHLIGLEAAYAINRVQMLASGYRPYIDFEFAYGPAHLYMPILLSHLTHSSVVRGYYLWWIIQWIAGTAMVWGAIRLIDLPLPRRRLIFWLIFAIQLPGIINEGTAYTPTRTIGPAFLIVLVASLWRRQDKPILIAGIAILCVVLAFAISPEQGAAVFAGLLVWFVLLATLSTNPFPPKATAIFTCGAVIVGIFCWHIGEFSTLKAFSAGGFAFPLLPSPTNIVILAAYVAAACIAVHSLLARGFDSVVVPLFLAGFALLPAALGRSDVGHLLMASPAWLIGVAAIESRPSLRKWWSPLAALFVIAPILVISLFLCVVHRHQSLSGLSQRAPATPNDPAIFAHGAGPCPIIYRTLNVSPKPTETSMHDCLDTGRYYLMVNALTPEAKDVMLRDLERRPLHPLVLLDATLADQFKPKEVNVTILHLLEFSPWVPQPRNQPLASKDLIEFIERNYTPASTPIGGFRIWYPKTSPVE